MAQAAPSTCPSLRPPLSIFTQGELSKNGSGNGHRECVKVLLDAGASPVGSIYNNCSPLLIAARDGNVDILQQLLDHGAETNVQARLPEWAANSVACSGPLYFAAVYGHLECFKMLLLYGADPNYNCTEERVIAQIKEPKTLLETCLRHRCKSEFIKLLIDFGANVYLPNLTVGETQPRSEGLELLLQARGKKTQVSNTEHVKRRTSQGHGEQVYHQ
ncbi:ankyrin repeat and socs box protein 12 [Limosa lapponica baueri]|uniref:Ankyrin repeat and socs box protein 12 n=1 Tax=Limosa lapponica baueri TaxID=1758121 RepID=A0A2I0T507_LIMLA|nr:ankyrin repeat and socs box protein 12 [Limosa lapponica baueri]